jgi:hypothetical protein
MTTKNCFIPYSKTLLYDKFEVVIGFNASLSFQLTARVKISNEQCLFTCQEWNKFLALRKIILSFITQPYSDVFYVKIGYLEYKMEMLREPIDIKIQLISSCPMYFYADSESSKQIINLTVTNLQTLFAHSKGISNTFKRYHILSTDLSDRLKQLIDAHKARPPVQREINEFREYLLVQCQNFKMENKFNEPPRQFQNLRTQIDSVLCDTLYSLISEL